MGNSINTGPVKEIKEIELHTHRITNRAHLHIMKSFKNGIHFDLNKIRELDSPIESL